MSNNINNYNVDELSEPDSKLSSKFGRAHNMIQSLENQL